VGTLVGPSAAGFAFDISRSYLLPIVASIGANLVAAGILLAMVRLDAPVKPAAAGAARGTVGNEPTTARRP
jgi:hypothetical protein